MAMIGQSLFLSSLEVVINRALPFDPVAEQKVRQLNGKKLAVRTHTPEIVATVIFSGDSIHIMAGIDNSIDDEPAADAYMETSSLTMARQAMRSHEQGIDSNISIVGNQDLIDDIHHIVSLLDIDWEEPLSHFVGDVAAHQMGNVGRGLLRWSKQTFDTLITGSDITGSGSPLHSRTSEAFQDHAEAVSKVRADVDQLQQRIDSLKNKLKNKETNLD